MVEIFKNIISYDEITCLLDYFKINDSRTDSRPDVTSKHPQWNIDDWPQDIVKRILDQLLDKSYSVDEVIFNQSKISFSLHADSGKENQPIYKAILIPLAITDHSGTAFFDNHWLYPSAKFTRQSFDPMIYTVFDCKNTAVSVKLNDFLVARDIERFPTYSNEYIEDLIKTRLTGNRYSKTDTRTNNYEKITGYIANKKFDKDIYDQHLSHINYEDLTGLTLDKIVPWKLGEVMVFDRTQLHCATSGHKFKIGITIFTELA
jgi:hypothetical protein